MVAFDLYNLEANPGFTAALDVDPDTANGDTATLITTMSTVDALTGSQTFIAALDDVRQQPPLTKPSPITPEAIYQWAVQFPASGFAERCGPDFAEKMLERKRAKGLL